MRRPTGVGGKILTRKFDTAPAMYEAGVAEIYDYSMTGRIRCAN